MPSKVVLFGVGIDPLTREQVLDRIRSALEKREKLLVTHVHVMGMNLAYRTPWLRDFFNSAGIVYCDGFGVRVGAWLTGQNLPERFTLADWMDSLMQVAVDTGARVFFLGNPPGVAARAAEQLQAAFPGLEISGAHHGYFDRTPGGEENDRVLAQVRAARPDLLLVGMGIPLQESWVRDNGEALDVPVVMTVGGVFEYWGGELVRAPRWVTDRGLEWLALTLQAPRRYWRRHLLGNPLFFFRVLRERFFSRSSDRTVAHSR